MSVVTVLLTALDLGEEGKFGFLYHSWLNAHVKSNVVKSDGHTPSLTEEGSFSLVSQCCISHVNDWLLIATIFLQSNTCLSEQFLCY